MDVCELKNVVLKIRGDVMTKAKRKISSIGTVGSFLKVA